MEQDSFWIGKFRFWLDFRTKSRFEMIIKVVSLSFDRDRNHVVRAFEFDQYLPSSLTSKRKATWNIRKADAPVDTSTPFRAFGRAKPATFVEAA